MQEETTYGEFKAHAKYFLKQLITKPSAARLDSFLAQRLRDMGVSQGDFVRMLEDGGVIIKKTKVDDGLGDDGTGKPTFFISYKIPAERFEHKLRKVYISLFERNVPAGEMDEATACAGDGAGQFLQPIGKAVIKRTIYVTEEQFNGLMNVLDEATAGEGVGDIEYDVPFPVDSNDPTIKQHQKGKKRGTDAHRNAAPKEAENYG